LIPACWQAGIKPNVAKGVMNHAPTVLLKITHLIDETWIEEAYNKNINY